jgi:clan AA aspartic protease
MIFEEAKMGEIRAEVKLTNAFDEERFSLGEIRSGEVRELTVDAFVDAGAVTSILPAHIVEKLGLRIRGKRVARYADWRNDAVDVTSSVVIEILGRNTIEDALVLGDEVLIGQTVLERLDILADCNSQRVIPNPARPNQPVLNVRSVRG